MARRNSEAIRLQVQAAFSRLANELADVMIAVVEAEDAGESAKPLKKTRARRRVVPPTAPVSETTKARAAAACKQAGLSVVDGGKR